jgi:hypothetical protein
MKSSIPMKIFDIYCPIKGFEAWLTAQPTRDNDNMPPSGGRPIALPGPLPASIIFPMKLAHGGAQ